QIQEICTLFTVYINKEPKAQTSSDKDLICEISAAPNVTNVSWICDNKIHFNFRCAALHQIINKITKSKRGKIFFHPTFQIFPM
ncbi:MAG: hypothetical protein ABWZ79_04750, partial [Pedobacter agri]